MENLNTRDCYRTLKDCPDCKRDISWLSQVPMILMTGAARAFMYAVYVARQGKPDRALSFLALADGLADDEERPYVLHLRSVFGFLSGNAEAAVKIGLEAKGASQALADRELQADVLAHLMEMHGASLAAAARRAEERNGRNRRQAPRRGVPVPARVVPASSSRRKRAQKRRQNCENRSVI